MRKDAVAMSVVAVATTFAWWNLSYHFGLFHDDGIYATTGKSLAEGRGYRLISVPTTPPQTKYPPLFPLLLAGVWRISPSFPENVIGLKTVGVACFGLSLFLAIRLFRQVDVRSDRWREAALLFVCGFNALSLPMTDFALSDHLFTVWVILATLVHSDGSKDDTQLRPVVVGALSSIASIMTRQAGLAVLLAGIVWAARRGRRSLIVYASIGAIFLAASIAQRTGVNSVSSNPLLAYYTAYELPAMIRLASDVGTAVGVVVDNVRYATSTAATVLFLNAVPGAVYVFGALILLGIPILVRSTGVFLPCFTLLYLGQVLLYPFAPGRYLLPLVVPLVLAVGVGTSALERAFYARFPIATKVAVRAVCHGPLALMVLASLTWAVSYSKPSTDSTTRVWFGTRTSYGWQGFQETFSWVARNTQPSDILATAYDPMYFLYTGRVGVRPWLHQPWTYFYPLNKPSADIGTAQQIKGELDELGATVLIVDPLDGFAERQAAQHLFGELLSLYGTNARLVFSSTDRLHQVYRLTAVSTEEPRLQ